MRKIVQSFMDEMIKLRKQFIRVHRNLSLQEIMGRIKIFFLALMRFLTSAIGKKFKSDIEFSFYYELFNPNNFSMIKCEGLSGFSNLNFFEWIKKTEIYNKGLN
jgi:hypothetical protein